jgi:lysophospholipase L1-like esterase
VSSRRRFLIGAAGVGAGATSARLLTPTALADASTPAGNPVAQVTSPQHQPLMPLYAGLAGRLTARCNIVCIGDSVTEGQHAFGPPFTGFENRWLARLSDLLRATYPTEGVGGGGRGFVGVGPTGENSFPWPVTLSGSLSGGTGFGPKGKWVQLAASGQSITFSLKGDSADIMWVQVPFGGKFSWAVDGGQATTISTNGSSTVDGRLTHIPLGTAGPHTLVLSWVSGNSSIDGVVEYNGDYAAGITVHDAAHYGWQSANWVSALNGGPAAAIAALAPAAVIVTLGYNDQYFGTAPATFQSNLQAIISELQAKLAHPLPAVILNMLPPRFNQSSFTYPWSAYVTAAYNVAAADTSGPGGTSLVTVFDFTSGPVMPGADTDVYGFWQPSDVVHPSDKGHQMIADCLRAFIATN